jgi:2-oxoglutarate-dependent dioxygenase
MAAGDPVVSADVPEGARQQYQQEGYVLLRGVISRDAAELLRREVMVIMDVIGLGQSKLRQTSEYLAGSGIDALVNSPNLLAIASALMEGPSTVYLPFTAVKSGGGGGEFHFHQDNQYTCLDAPGNNLWIALTPMREDNGCIRVVPRSHLHGTLPSAESPDKDGHRTVTFQPEDFAPILMEPGDCLAFTRLTVHGSGPNTTDTHRVAYAVQFHRDDANYSTDAGETWKSAKEQPRWRTGPVEAITLPKDKLDGH